MREIKQIQLAPSQSISAKSEPVFQFALPQGNLLFIFFFNDSTQSYCKTLPIKDFEVGQLQKELENHSDLNLKILCAASGPQEKLEFESLLTRLRSTSIKISGSAVRESELRGNLSFIEKRVQVEKQNKKIKLLIVDDSKTIRDLLTNVFSKDSEIEVVATAEHPHLVEELIQKHSPDVITLDIHMPDMDGVTLLKSYIAKFPIPTVMISSITYEDGPYVLNALESGAVDYIQKPSMSELKTLAPLMIEKIKAASRSKVRPRIEYSSTPVAKKAVSSNYDPNALIVIGSSTGGTEALKVVFKQMPDSIPPILVVQHIPPVFSKAFADRLNQMLPYTVKEAADGDLVVPNQILIAPGGKQMELVAHGANEFKVRINDDAPVNRHKPSVDYLFHSVVKFSDRRNVIAAVLTGMGADGARGLKELRDKGARTMAQDEPSSVVYGMPKEAARMGGAEKILPLDRIGTELIKIASEPSTQKKKLSA